MENDIDELYHIYITEEYFLAVEFNEFAKWARTVNLLEYRKSNKEKSSKK